MPCFAWERGAITSSVQPGSQRQFPYRAHTKADRPDRGRCSRDVALGPEALAKYRAQVTSGSFISCQGPDSARP